MLLNLSVGLLVVKYSCQPATYCDGVIPVPPFEKVLNAAVMTFGGKPRILKKKLYSEIKHST